MNDRQLEEKKVWYIARVQAIVTVLLYVMNLVYFNAVVLAVFTIFTFFCGLAYLYYYFTKRYKHWSVLFLVLISSDFGYYVFSGGNQGAGILWSLVLPFLAMYLRGYKVGSFFSIIYLSVLLVAIVIAYVIELALPYSNTFLFVFFLVNSSLLILLYKIEKGRTLIQEDYNRIENLFIHATDLLFIGTIKGNFLTVNPSCTDILGWSKDEWLDKPYLEFVHPDDIERSRVKIQEFSYSKGTTYSILENRFMCKDGSYKWLSWRTVYDSDKKLVYAIARDITEKKEQEESLDERAGLQSIIVELSAEFINSTPENLEEKIKELLQRVGQFLGYDRAYLIRMNKDVNPTIGVVEWNKEGCTSLNDMLHQFNLFGHPMLQSFMMMLDVLYVPKIEEYIDEPTWLKEMSLQQQIQSIFLLPLVRNGQNVAVIGFDTIGHAKEISAELIELVKVLTQLITEVLMKNEVDLHLRDAAIKLDDLNKTKDKLFSIIAHDLRSPLSTIIGFSEIMTDEEEPFSVPILQGYAKLLNHVALSTFDLLENLLDWSRLQRGMLKPERTKVLVEELVQEAIGPFADKAESKNIWVTIQMEPGLKIDVDKRMMETVIRNLFTNALKFTPEGGTITLKAERARDNKLSLCVSDSGIGIPKSMLPLLFTANEVKNRQGLGGEHSSGLGLMLCKEFIDLHQGSIHVETTENKGSTFCINLPCLLTSRTI